MLTNTNAHPRRARMPFGHSLTRKRSEESSRWDTGAFAGQRRPKEASAHAGKQPGELAWHLCPPGHMFVRVSLRSGLQSRHHMEPGPGPFVSLPGDGLALFIGTAKATEGQTAGSFELIELSAPGGNDSTGPPPHVHREHDEGFYILDGSFTFVLGREEFDAPQGSFVFVPRGTRHGFVSTAGARALLVIVPSGLEGFFRELGEGLASGRSNSELRAELAKRYDSEEIP